jgi:hypothetical protein
MLSSPNMAGPSRLQVLPFDVIAIKMALASAFVLENTGQLRLVTTTRSKDETSELLKKHNETSG